MKKANAKTFFLVRNGERLFAVFNEVTLGRRLFPAADEFAKMFHDHQGRPLEPGSFGWDEAEKRADATRRQYMKVGLLLQGLADRTTILHPHPKEGMNLLDQGAIDAGRILLIPDAEDSYALGDGSERFADWRKRINAHLRPGMRVIVASDSEAFRGLEYDHRDYQHGHARLHPKTSNYPNPKIVYTIEQRRPDGGLVIRYERTDEVWSNERSRPAKTRASCTVYAEDSFVLAYDAADPDLLRSFLRNRTDRVRYLDMVPVINIAIAAKKQEQAAETPFRQMVVGMLMQQPGVDLTEADQTAVDLIDWWKFANRFHRPLTGRGAEADAKAAREILAEFRRRQHTEHSRATQEVVEILATQHPDALLIAQSHAGHLMVLTPHANGPFVTEHTYNRKGKRRDSRNWILPGTRPNRWTVLRSTPQWESWDRNATLTEHLTDPEREALVEIAIQRARAACPDREIAAVTLHKEHEVIAWAVTSWGEADEKHPATGKRETVTLEGHDFSWHRDRRRQVVAGQCSPWGIRRHWDERGDRHPWEGAWGKTVSVLWLDADVVQRAEACHAHYQAIKQRGREIVDAARAVYRAAESNWQARKDREAYKAFLAKYGDPGLWESHRKTIKFSSMPEPSGQPWLTALTALIENGEDPATYTLGQALEAIGVADIPPAVQTLPLHHPA